MIDHIVLLRPRAEATEAQIDALREGIFGLRDRIPGILDIAWGANVSVEQLDQGYLLGFIVRFADASARDDYLPHPAHVAIVPQVHAVAERTLVFDLDRS
ncbi:MAG TPA: Dabb family protein [Thermomicrobiales bacterium]|nr:Dabb family protein [Thermomicrobiales bacterium]